MEIVQVIAFECPSVNCWCPKHSGSQKLIFFEPVSPEIYSEFRNFHAAINLDFDIKLNENEAFSLSNPSAIIFATSLIQMRWAQS